MPLYYFHIRNGSKLEKDPDGVELPGIEAAHFEALKVARELRSELADFGNDAAIEIVDEAGQMLRTVMFSEAARG